MDPDDPVLDFCNRIFSVHMDSDDSLGDVMAAVPGYLL